MDDDADAESVQEELGISLHDLTGIDVGNTMKLPVVINGVSLVALVDSGSTHTFIQEMSKVSLSMEIATWRHTPVLGTRSSFATLTERPVRRSTVSPSLSTSPSWMKV